MADSGKLRDMIRQDSHLPDYLQYEHMEKGIIEKMVRKQKRKRRFFWLLIPSALVILGLSFYFYRAAESGDVKQAKPVNQSDAKYAVGTSEDGYRNEPAGKKSDVTAANTTSQPETDPVPVAVPGIRNTQQGDISLSAVTGRPVQQAVNNLRTGENGANAVHVQPVPQDQDVQLKMMEHSDPVVIGDARETSESAIVALLSTGILPVKCNTGGTEFRDMAYSNTGRILPAATKQYPFSLEATGGMVFWKGGGTTDVNISGSEHNAQYSIRPLNGWTGGLRVVKQLAAHHQLIAGLRLLNTWSVFEYSGTQVRKDTLTDQVIAKEINLITGSQSNIRGTLVQESSIRRSTRHLNKSLYVQIPVSWQYSASYRRWTTIAGGGLAATVYSRHAGKTLAGQSVTEYTGDHPLAGKGIDLQWELRASTAYHFSGSWSIGLGVELLRPLGSTRYADDIISKPQFLVGNVKITKAM